MSAIVDYWYRASWELKERVRRAQDWWSRLTRGYADIDWFNYYRENSKRAVKLLTVLLEEGHSGCPGGWGCEKCLPHSWVFDTEGEAVTPWNCDCKPFERWQDAIRDMIFFHRVCADDYEETEHVDMEDPLMRRAYFLSGGVSFQSREDAQRYRRGSYYYHRWYRHLRD